MWEARGRLFGGGLDDVGGFCRRRTGQGFLGREFREDDERKEGQQKCCDFSGAGAFLDEHDELLRFEEEHDRVT